MPLQTPSAWTCQRGLSACEIHHISGFILQLISKLQSEDLEAVGRVLVV